MKSYISILVALCLSLSSCATLTLSQKGALSRASQISLNLAQAVANTAIQIVIAKATNDSDLIKKGNLLDSAAAGLRTLDTKSGGLITPQLVSNAILQFTDPSKSHWGDMAKSISKEVTESSLPRAEAIELAASALNSIARDTRIPTQP